MTTPRDPNNLLSAYLANGIDVLPDRVVDAVLDEAHRTRQRTVLGPRRTPVMNSTFKVILAAAAVVAVAVVGIGFAALPRSNPSIGSGPSTPPSASPASGPTASPERHARTDLADRPDRLRADGGWQHRYLHDEPGPNGTRAPDRRCCDGFRAELISMARASPSHADLLASVTSTWLTPMELARPV